MHQLSTARLNLHPYTVELIRAASVNKPLLAGLLSARVPDEWPDPDYAGFLPFIVQRLARSPAQGPWDRLIIHRADRTLIGHIGFKGGPNGEGTVNIGYHIIPTYRGQGLATEAGQAMVAWALRQPGIRRITATCDGRNHASARVLERLGLQQVGIMGADLLWMMDTRRDGSTPT